MRRILFLGFILALEVLVWVKYPIGGIYLPIGLIVILVGSTLERWSPTQILLCVAIYSYVLDVFVARHAGQILLSSIGTAGLFILVRHQFNSPNQRALLLRPYVLGSSSYCVCLYLFGRNAVGTFAPLLLWRAVWMVILMTCFAVIVHWSGERNSLFRSRRRIG